MMLDFDMCSVNEFIHSCSMVRLISSSLLPVHCSLTGCRHRRKSVRYRHGYRKRQPWDLDGLMSPGFSSSVSLSQSKILSRLQRPEAELRASQLAERPTSSE